MFSCKGAVFSLVRLIDNHLFGIFILHHIYTHVYIYILRIYKHTYTHIYISIQTNITISLELSVSWISQSLGKRVMLL